jgi:hypothetical protein
MKKIVGAFAAAALLTGTPALAVDTQNKDNVGAKSEEKAAGGLGADHDKSATGSTTTTGSGMTQPPKEPTGGSGKASEPEKNQLK